MQLCDVASTWPVTASTVRAARCGSPARLGARIWPEGVSRAFATPGPVLLDVLTHPEEISVPAKPTIQQGRGFAIAKIRENLTSPGGRGHQTRETGPRHVWAA
jgi:hypothetical protein